MKKFEVIGWIHPKTGGDDKEFILEITAENEDNAKKITEKWLKRRSAITNDFVIKEFKKLKKVV